MSAVLVNPPHHHFRQSHLDHVVQEMMRRGSPVLKAYFDGEMWHAREGTHRLRAAKILGMTPILVPVEWRRTRASLERARFSAPLTAHLFSSVAVRIPQ